MSNIDILEDGDVEEFVPGAWATYSYNPYDLEDEDEEDTSCMSCTNCSCRSFGEDD